MEKTNEEERIFEKWYNVPYTEADEEGSRRILKDGSKSKWGSAYKTNEIRDERVFKSAINEARLSQLEECIKVVREEQQILLKGFKAMEEHGHEIPKFEPIALISNLEDIIKALSALKDNAET